MLKDINSVRLSGTIFWSKLDDKQSFSMLRVGIKLEDGTSIFATINNPKTNAYDVIKAGNKIMLMNAWLDTWERKDGTRELQIKAYDSNSQFFPKETGLLPLNEVTMAGKVLGYESEFATLEMIGERNPKTGQYAKRQAEVKIGDKYEKIVGKKMLLQGILSSEEVEGGKTKMLVKADYDKITIL